MLYPMNPSIFPRAFQTLARTALSVGGIVLFAAQVRAVSLSLVVTNITMPAGLTFQMPITASDPDGLPLRFSATVSKKSTVTAAFAPGTNRSLLLDVSGVDASNGTFEGEMVLQLFEDLTPLTTARIIDLVNSNFYNGLLFHRVIQNFVAQAGGATNDVNFKSGVKFDDEYVKTLTYDGFGQLGMANGAPNTHDSNDSQFFITDADLSVGNPATPSPESLNFEQPIFGQLTSGFDVLAKVMETPVGPNPNDTTELSEPLSNVVINTATIITNSQDAVLRLTASPKFIGTVTVIVTATNAENQVAAETFSVKVIPNTNNSAAFLGPIPANTVVTQNTAATFILKTTDIDGDQTGLALDDTDTHAFPTNLVASITPKTGRLFFSPDLTVTGDVHLAIFVKDSGHGYDRQDFTLTFLPRSATPTMTIVPLKGTMQDASKPLGDKIKVSGTFAFNSPSDQTFGSNDVLVLTLGDPTTPLTATITPDSKGWKFRNGVLNAKAHVISGLSSNVNVSAQFSLVKSTFSISVSGFDFPVALSNQIQVGVALGNDYGTDVRTWVTKKPGTFVPPAP